MAGARLIVYAVCPPRQQVDCAGMAGEPLRVVRAARLAAVAGELRRTPQPSLAALRRYDAVLHALAGELAAMLPARFGTCVTGEAELVAVLRARDLALRAALREVRGCVQMTLRSVDLHPAPALPPAPAHVDRGSGLGYLRARAAEASRARDVPALAPVLCAVARWVRAVRVTHSGSVASVYHLVPRGAVPSYATAAREAAHAAGLHVLVAGPFPAYAFGEG